MGSVVTMSDIHIEYITQEIGHASFKYMELLEEVSMY